MKKFFTLIAFAIAALTANASATLDMPSSWGDGCAVDGTTYTFTGQWKGAGTWLGTQESETSPTVWYDAKDYDYAVCTYEGHTGGDVNFGVCYNKVISHESWGDNYATETVVIDQPSGFVALALNKTSDAEGGGKYINEIRQVQIQNGSTNAEVKITGIYFMTTAEYEALKAGDKTVKTKEFGLPSLADKKEYNGIVAMPASQKSSGWNSTDWIGATGLDSQYKTLVFEVKAEHQFKLNIQAWGGDEDHAQMYSYNVSGSATPVLVCIPLSDLAYPGLGQYAIQNLYIAEYNDATMDPKTGNMIDNNVYGDNTVTFTKAYATSEEVASTYTEWVDPNAGIEEIVADSAASKKAVKVAKDGKIVIVKGNAEFNVAGQLVK